MPTAAHFLYIPAVLLLGVVILSFVALGNFITLFAVFSQSAL